MNDIIEILSQKELFISSGKTTEESVKEAEIRLGVNFAKEYREYVCSFGTASYYGHELTGISKNEPLLDVVDITLAEREFLKDIPNTWYVIEQTHMDGIVIWQDEKGKVFRTIPNKSAEKIFDSLCEYIEKG